VRIGLYALRNKGKSLTSVKFLVMNLVLEKQKIKQEIDNIDDESILMSIKKLLGMIKGKSLTVLSKEELIVRALESEKAIAEKRTLSIDELEEEMRNW
jgi:hypothetical protein